MMNSSSNDHLSLGIDIGGSHITVGLINLAMKKIIDDSIERKKVNRHAPAEEILGIWAAAINDMQEQDHGSFTEVGFAMPGPFDYEHGICLIKGFDKYESLYGMNIREELAARTGIAGENILFKNDADAFLEGEIFCGAAKGFHRAVGLTLGTGLGSCSYENGKISNAGLNELPYKDGIAEDYISSRWFEKIYYQYTGSKVNGVKLIADAFQEDENARRIFSEFAGNLAAVLRHCIRSFNPEVIVLGGNIANAFPLFIEPVKTQLSAEGEVPVIVKAILNENAALIGAASSFEQKRIIEIIDF